VVETPVQSRPDDRAAAATDATPAVRTVGLCKSIDGRQILRDVAIEVPAGRFVAVLGANGSGKSTLLKVLATLIPASAGQVQLFGETASATSAHLRRRIGLIGHDSMLYRDLTARENLEFFAKLYRVESPADRAAQMLDAVGLGHRANDRVGSFSRGMIQRVAIARALLHRPELILADEPFAGLDAPSIASLENLFEQIHLAGKTIVMVNHDIDQSLRIAEHAIVLRHGRVAVNQASYKLYPREVLSEVQS
jgi:heme exporter protein A